MIAGEWQTDCGKSIDVTNPATGLKFGTVPVSDQVETRRAIEAAETTFQIWRKTSALKRSKLLRALHDAIMDNRQPPAELLTSEQGKSLAESKGEIESRSKRSGRTEGCATARHYMLHIARCRRLLAIRLVPARSLGRAQ